MMFIDPAFAIDLLCNWRTTLRKRYDYFFPKMIDSQEPTFLKGLAYVDYRLFSINPGQLCEAIIFIKRKYPSIDAVRFGCEGDDVIFYGDKDFWLDSIRKEMRNLENSGFFQNLDRKYLCDTIILGKKCVSFDEQV